MENKQFHTTGWLSSVDPRPKLLLIPILAPALFIYPVNPFGITVLILLHLILLSTKTSFRQIWDIWKSLIIVNVIIIGFAALPIGEGLIEGIFRAIRIDGLSFLFWLPLLTTTPLELKRGAEKMGLPHTLGLMLEIAVNFIPELKQQVKIIEEATYCRGYSPSDYPWYRRFQKKLPQLLALMISAIRRSETLGRILETRGYGMRGRRSVFHDIHLRKRDSLFLILEILFCAGLYFGPFYLKGHTIPYLSLAITRLNEILSSFLNIHKIF